VDFDFTNQLLIRFETVHTPFIDFKKTYDSVMREVLYNVLTESGIPTKQFRLIKICLNETYSNSLICKHLSDMFSFQNGLKNKEMFYRHCFSTLF
jgi:hypothetical protein